MNRRSAAAALAATLLAAVALAGCGAEAPDLFAVERSGVGPNARLSMVVNDSGQVTCNGKSHPLDSNDLLRARDVARKLDDQAQLHLQLPPGPNSILSYKVRLESGTVGFSDTSANLPSSFTALELLTKDISENVCKITR